MSETKIAPRQVDVRADDDDGLSHIVCCDRNRALCGRDLTDAHNCPEDLSCGCLECVVCLDLEDAACPGCGW